MRSPAVFALSFVLLIASSAWASNATALTCGLLCIQSSVIAPTSPCSPTNATCICTNEALNLEISACVFADCTIREQLALQGYSKHSCGVPSEDRTMLVKVIALVFGAFGLVAFALRVASRVLVGNQAWGPDDWVLTVAVCLMLSLAGFSVPIANHGLGKDIWDIDPDDITRILYLYFWDELIYLGALPIIKIAILLFYLKIFPKREIKIAVYILIGLNVGYFIAFEVVSIFQCTPIQGAWLAWDGTFEATCRDINMQGWMAAAFNIVLDVATLALPLPELWNLSMSLKKKIQVMSMFVVGFFVTFVSIIRLQSLAKYGSSGNFTQNYVEVGYWSTIEVPVAVACACMPAIRALLSLRLPSIFGTTRAGTGVDSSSKFTLSAGTKLSARFIRVKKEFSVKSNPIDTSTDLEMNKLHGAANWRYDKASSEVNLVAEQTNVSGASLYLDRSERKP